MPRETLASASSSSSSSSSTSSSGANNPPPEGAWVDAYQRLLPQWQSLSLSPRSIIPISISRVNQVDAQRLDIEMSAMLKEQLVKDCYFNMNLNLMLFLSFSFGDSPFGLICPHPGNALMNLRYRDERAIEPRGKVRTGLEGPGLTVVQKLWYCIATVGGQYIWSHLQSFSAFRRWGDSEQARLVYGSPNMNRAVSFEYMNRQLVWNEFSDKSSNSGVDDAVCPICLASPNIPFLALLFSTATVITAFDHGVLRLRHSGATDAMSQLLPCNGMGKLLIGHNS
ncbi:hypothetical protein HYC85_016634 [Camellia sinensis]|uniref:Pex N-terminal domain-containing protein n=1 Tax=Camellia sinensis TaxID=4442 RepID=A0A7J7H3X4_CAMSI|nr:hypothetical protein HYC85_016634 [Camellia sinensis]